MKRRWQTQTPRLAVTVKPGWTLAVGLCFPNVQLVQTLVCWLSYISIRLVRPFVNLDKTQASRITRRIRGWFYSNCSSDCKPDCRRRQICLTKHVAASGWWHRGINPFLNSNMARQEKYARKTPTFHRVGTICRSRRIGCGFHSKISWICFPLLSHMRLYCIILKIGVTSRL
jgi:hypothetical protein